MNASSSKLAAGIVAGLVIGIGGSVAYVKLSSRPQQPALVAAANPAAAPTATLPDAGLTTAPAPASPADQSTQPARPLESEAHTLRHKSRHAQPAQPVEPPQMAQNEAQPAAPFEQPVSQNQVDPANPYAWPPQAPGKPARPAVQEPSSVAPAAPPPPPAPRVVTLNAGTNLNVRTVQTISTKDAQAGDTFRGTLDSPIIRDGAVIAEKGSAVTGTIVVADRPGHVSRHSDLQLQLTYINTSDGQRIPVQTSILDKQGTGNTKGNAEKVGGGAALGAIIGAIAGGGKGAAIGAGAGSAAGVGGVLLTRGKDVELPSETALTFQLSQPVTITEQMH